MNWMRMLLFNSSELQAVIIISLICALGLVLGKVRFWGVSLGVTFVFFIGILFGSIGLRIQPDMLAYAESFGLVLFVYALGLQVGPGFFTAFRKDGATQNLLGLSVIAIDLLVVSLSFVFSKINLSETVGILCGATTNTPALGAAQQMLKQVHMEAASSALSCAVTYPLGVVGVILVLLLLKIRFKKKIVGENNNDNEINTPYIVSYIVSNPALFNHPIHDIAHMCEKKFVISRVWREGNVILPDSDTMLYDGDKILVIVSKKQVEALTIFFGKLDKTDWNEKDVDWNSIDAQLISQRILITRPEINGKTMGALHLRNRFGVNVSRVFRSGIQLMATSDLVLCMGDRLTVVGDVEAIHKVAKELGNTVKDLDEPNLVAIFIGIVLGLLLGAIPFSIPGISLPIKLGLAGGPIIVGLLIGAFGPRFHMITYTTNSANRMLRSLGLSTYLACLGLDAGVHFFDIVMRPEGLIWIGLGSFITIIPIIIVGYVSIRYLNQDYSTTAGMLCGSMANPMALNYVSDTIPGEKALVAYTTVYPLCMFVRVLSIQILILTML